MTRVVDKTGTGNPFLTLLAALSVAIFFNAGMGDASVILDDIWDASVLLVVFQLDLIKNEVHCPMLGVHEGF
jgi:hypothetical protein